MNAVLENGEKVWTYEEYANLGEDTRFEILDGKALMAPAPELLLQRWAGKIYLAVQRHVETHKLGEVFFSPVDVVLDARNVVRPDLVFVSTERSNLLEHRGIMGAPDLVVEIISAGSLRRDRYEKRELYARFGVQEFWLADVANRAIEVLSLSQGQYQLLSCATNQGKIFSGVLSGFELDLAQLS